MANDDQISLFEFSQLEFSQLESHPAPPPEFDPELIPTDARVPIPAGTYQTMEQMKAHCNRCFRCGLGESRTNAVIGRGNDKASIMIVGEGPGQNEDETGIAFVGKAGQLLDKILASVNLTERDVYICNVVKCRPPNNRDPQPAEIEACNGYLREQIRLVNPKIILLTGKYAMLTLLGIKQGITKVRGQWVERDGRLYMPIFHPAYLLRNQSREKGSPKWLMWQDIQAVRQKLDEIQRGEG
ncbi:uracil-DNA glycosylase [Leptothermofonsia sichuanensis E412]|uniref:uracil-DNA glycosylase n=1 Tax=Leptothermofonsia sichuanensis TaxID=2917832 RepID=UPI001CA63A22|nr:uracil-DNA glycosylase [Leptothermofonsia sichuanensis]QZZ22443.1 uracil-DNA glycosylase [Leptothermofonsia sichuanensis E412]